MWHSRDKVFSILQICRGFAALGVVIFYLSLVINDEFGLPHWVLAVSGLGRHGVEFFFALSGFLILLAHKMDIQHPTRIGAYFFERVIRMYPLYWISTLLVLSVIFTTKHTGPHDWKSILSFATLVKFGGVAHPNLPAWTMFHEILLYLIFRILIFNKYAGIGVLTIWVICIYAFGAHRADYEQQSLYVAAHPINLCFLGGMGGYAALKLCRPSWAPTLISTGIVLIIGALCLIDEHNNYLLFFTTIGTGFGMFFAGTVVHEKTEAIKQPSFWSSVGSASYSIYLFHVIIIIGILKFFRMQGISGILGIWGATGSVLIITLGASALIYKYVESPINRNFKQGLMQRAALQLSSLHMLQNRRNK